MIAAAVTRPTQPALRARLLAFSAARSSRVRVLTRPFFRYQRRHRARPHGRQCAWRPLFVLERRANSDTGFGSPQAPQSFVSAVISSTAPAARSADQVERGSCGPGRRSRSRARHKKRRGRIHAGGDRRGGPCKGRACSRGPPRPSPELRRDPSPMRSAQPRELLLASLGPVAKSALTPFLRGPRARRLALGRALVHAAAPWKRRMWSLEFTQTTRLERRLSRLLAFR